ncbi:uncharacterized protein F5Z01DRAFT_123546 [Emericellopsis atlantica]|uniref:CCHC-type domain-containing protein n=1 Tax=Emericellopsis atlantica TaxID=2614577 RepID=A0A9P8CP09_9HYPO|nr:uncharacterized protein F5Z01DRAFT_123546 [Emericellopsis atlantica]KAG9253692.1 hypothetical protein F5Z01DRAFT_123546 [Emericellopsis atlantica]
MRLAVALVIAPMTAPSLPTSVVKWATSARIAKSRRRASTVVKRATSSSVARSQRTIQSQDCPEPKAERSREIIACPNCNEEGHRLLYCKQPRVDKNACRNCGRSGCHKFFGCPKPKDYSKITCSVCKEKGHTKLDARKRTARLAVAHLATTTLVLWTRAWTMPEHNDITI